MFVQFGSDNVDQKELYFRLSAAFNLLGHGASCNNKTAGLYAIFSSNICYYVGQSQNVASRLATHIKGRFNFDNTRILIFLPTENSFSNFYERSCQSRKLILEGNEKFLISKLKPVENREANYEGIDFDERKHFDSFAPDINDRFRQSVEITIEFGDLLICSADMELSDSCIASNSLAKCCMDYLEALKIDYFIHSQTERYS